MTPSQIEQACLVVAHPKFEWRDGMKPVSPSNPEAPYASCIRLGRSLADEDEWEEDPESRFYPPHGLVTRGGTVSAGVASSDFRLAPRPARPRHAGVHARPRAGGVGGPMLVRHVLPRRRTR